MRPPSRHSECGDDTFLCPATATNSSKWSETQNVELNHTYTGIHTHTHTHTHTQDPRPLTEKTLASVSFSLFISCVPFTPLLLKFRIGCHCDCCSIVSSLCVCVCRSAPRGRHPNLTGSIGWQGCDLFICAFFHK